MKYSLALLGVVAAIGLAGPVQAEHAARPLTADPYFYSNRETDEAFLAALDGASISYSNPESAVDTGKLLCYYTKHGQSITDLLNDMTIRNPGLTADHAQKFAVFAAKFFCPEELMQHPPRDAT